MATAQQSTVITKKTVAFDFLQRRSSPDQVDEDDDDNDDED